MNTDLQDRPFKLWDLEKQRKSICTVLYWEISENYRIYRCIFDLKFFSYEMGFALYMGKYCNIITQHTLFSDISGCIPSSAEVSKTERTGEYEGALIKSAMSVFSLRLNGLILSICSEALSWWIICADRKLRGKFEIKRSRSKVIKIKEQIMGFETSYLYKCMYI